MKQLFAILTSLFIFCGCDIIFNTDDPGGKDNPKDVRNLSASVQQIMFTASGGEQSFTVTTTEKNWTAGVAVNWLSVSTEGNTVVVTADPNRNLEEREGTVYLSAGDYSLEISVMQEAKGAGGESTEKGGTADGYNPYQEYEFEVSENTMFMRDNVAKEIVEADLSNCVFTLTKDTPAELVPQVGEHYVVNNRLDLFPNGALMFIQEVTETDDGYEVGYSNDGLNAVFNQLPIDEKELDITSSVKKIIDLDGNEIQFTKTKAAESKNWTLTLPEVAWEIGGGFELTPKMTINNTLKLQLLMDDWRISTFNVVYDADVTLGADLAISLETPSISYYHKLFTIICGAIPVGPIMVTPNIDFFAMVSASGSVSFEGSVSYQTRAVASAHYDEINYLSGELSKKDNDKFEYSVGPKVSGTFDYGLLIGPSVGIYGETVEVGFGLSFRLQEEISHKNNVADPKTWNHSDELSWGIALQEADFANNFMLGGNVFMTGLGIPLTKDLSDIKFPLESVKLIPTVSDVCIAEANGKELTFSTWVKNKALYYPELFLDIGDGELYPFDFDKGKINELENGVDSVQISARLTVKDDSQHNFEVCCTMWDMDAKLQRYITYGQYVDENEEYAMKAILADICASRVGEWQECDWLDGKKGVANMKNISYYKDGQGKSRYQVLVPPSWKMTDNLYIGNHSSAVKNFEWGLDVEGDRQFDKVQIDDACCTYGFVGDNCNTYIYHSTCETFGAVIPDNVKVIDLSGSNVKDFRISPFRNGTDFKPEEVIMNNCPKLESIAFGRSDDDKMMDAPKVSAKNCPKLKSVSFSYANVKGGFLDNVEMTGGSLYLYGLKGLNDLNISIKCVKFSISKCSFTSLDLSQAQNMKNADIYDCSFTSARMSGMNSLSKAQVVRSTAESVVIADCPNLDYVSVDSNDMPACIVASLSVTNCASLKTLFCPNIGMSSFEASGLPAIDYLVCNKNKNLSGLMLPVFDQMYEAGFLPVYDIRYEYEWEELKKDNGYGYYYAGEPERGYHHYD